MLMPHEIHNAAVAAGHPVEFVSIGQDGEVTLHFAESVTAKQRSAAIAAMEQITLAAHKAQAIREANQEARERAIQILVSGDTARNQKVAAIQSATTREQIETAKRAR
jgi:hypothetical protein